MVSIFADINAARNVLGRFPVGRKPGTIERAHLANRVESQGPIRLAVARGRWTGCPWPVTGDSGGPEHPFVGVSQPKQINYCVIIGPAMLATANWIDG
jgi:hypothetical protein